MHLLQSGADIAVIALWLGHESIETTHEYVEADLASKQKALEKLAPAQHKLHVISLKMNCRNSSPGSDYSAYDQHGNQLSSPITA
jgi:hypothetical protein